MGLPIVKVEELGYVPSAHWGRGLETYEPVDAGELLNENIARIESLKLKLGQLAVASEAERAQLLENLDTLRSAFIAFASRAAGSGAIEAAQAAGGLAFPQQDKLIIEGIIGNSPAITQLLKTIQSIAPTNLTVLLEGETGTGKELFARIIHLNSGREKFVAVNCGAFPGGLIESELFGHVKGAFTSSRADRGGKFEEANDGTIFLDEIGDLEPSAQVKLLRVLETGELQRVGSDKSRKVNVRVIAATNRNLEDMVQRGNFREDLYYRINVCPLYLPPLRERRDEIEILLEYFLREACAKQHKQPPRLDSDLRQYLCKVHGYRGNIRELRNIAQFLACVAAERPLSLTDLPARVLGGAYRHDPLANKAPGRKTLLLEAEKVYWHQMLKKHQGNIQQICAETQLSRSRVYQILEALGLQANDFRTA